MLALTRQSALATPRAPAGAGPDPARSRARQPLFDCRAGSAPTRRPAPLDGNGQLDHQVGTLSPRRGRRSSPIRPATETTRPPFPDTGIPPRGDCPARSPLRSTRSGRSIFRHNSSRSCGLFRMTNHGYRRSNSRAPLLRNWRSRRRHPRRRHARAVSSRAWPPLADHAAREVGSTGPMRDSPAPMNRFVKKYKTQHLEELHHVGGPSGYGKPAVGGRCFDRARKNLPSSASIPTG